MISSAIAIKIVTTVMAAVILIGVGSLFVASALEGIGLVIGSVVLVTSLAKALGLFSGTLA